MIIKENIILKFLRRILISNTTLKYIRHGFEGKIYFQTMTLKLSSKCISQYMVLQTKL